MGWISAENLQAMGFGAIGQNVKIDESARIYDPSTVFLGSNLRIDAGASLSSSQFAPIEIHSFVHIATNVSIFSGEGVVFECGSGASVGSAIFGKTDDYSIGYLRNPMVPDQMRKLTVGRVRLGAGSVLGSGTVVLPGVSVGLASSTAALSVVSKDVPDLSILLRDNKVRALRDPELTRRLLLELEVCSRCQLAVLEGLSA